MAKKQNFQYKVFFTGGLRLCDSRLDDSVLVIAPPNPVLFPTLAAPILKPRLFDALVA
jgi:hypothetical protein